MKLVHPQLTLRTMLAFVALAAVALAGLERVRRQHEAARWAAEDERLAARAAWATRMQQRGYISAKAVAEARTELERHHTPLPARKP